MKEERSININITGGSFIRAVLVVILILFLFYVRDIVLVVLAAVVIASAVEPAAKWLKKYHIYRLPSIILIYLGIGAFLASFLIFFLPMVIQQTIGFLNGLPNTISLSDIWSPLRDTGILSGSVAHLPDQTFSVSSIITALQVAVSGTGSGAFHIANAIFGGALSFFLIAILSFYLAVQEEGIPDFLRIVTPVQSHDYIIDLWKRSQIKIGQWMQGQILLGLMMGVLVYIGLLAMGVKHALLLAFLAACFEIIPVFGPIFSAIPAILSAYALGGLTQGLIVLGFYLFIHQLENNFLYPLVVKKIVGVSPILVILALIVGAKLAGFLGAILAVPIAAALMEYISDIEKHKRHQREAPLF